MAPNAICSKICAYLFAISTVTIFIVIGCFACIPYEKVFPERNIAACVSLLTLGATGVASVCAAIIGGAIGYAIDVTIDRSSR